MGDVENTILQHFEKEKNDFRSKSDLYFEDFSANPHFLKLLKIQNHYEN